MDLTIDQISAACRDSLLCDVQVLAAAAAPFFARLLVIGAVLTVVVAAVRLVRR